MTVLGIDVYNGNSDSYDFGRVKAEGVGFVIHKASQGWMGGSGGWKDWKFVGATNRIRAAGLLPGGYHWLLKGHGKEQAQNFFEALQSVNGPGGLLAAVDVERNDWDQSLNPDAQTLRDFLAEWDHLSDGQSIFVYGAEWYWGPYMGEPRDFANRPLWWAGYYQRTSSVGIQEAVKDVTPGYFASFGGWAKYAVRQWASNVLVSGNSSDVDYFPGSLDDLKKMTGKSTAPVSVPSPPAQVDVRKIQGAVHATVDGIWGNDTDRRLELLRHKGPVNLLQTVLDVRSDGVWGPVSQAAYTKAAKLVQEGLHVAVVDGVWGPVTDKAYLAASPVR